MKRNQGRTFHVGQLNLPKQSVVSEQICGLFDPEQQINDGHRVKAFEQSLAEKLDVKHVFAVNNGTFALLAGMKALQLKGEVIVPSFTFIATIQAIIWAGLTPIFCDVDEQSHNISADTVEPLINQNTAAIVGVHLWGNSCPVDELEALAQKHNIPLIFDAAHAFGTRYKDIGISNFGLFSGFSFHATKVMNASEGGVIATQYDWVAEELRALGTLNDYSSALHSKAFNFQMSEVQSIIGHQSLMEFEDNKQRNVCSMQRYKERLKSVQGIEFYKFSKDCTDSNYQYLVLRVTADAKFTRYDLMKGLRKQNILARDYFSPPIHKLGFCREYVSDDLGLPVTDMLSESLMQLPMGQAVSMDDIDFICDKIIEIV